MTENLNRILQGISWNDPKSVWKAIPKRGNFSWSCRYLRRISGNTKESLNVCQTTNPTMSPMWLSISRLNVISYRVRPPRAPRLLDRQHFSVAYEWVEINTILIFFQLIVSAAERVAVFGPFRTLKWILPFQAAINEFDNCRLSLPCAVNNHSYRLIINTIDGYSSWVTTGVIGAK